MQSSINGKNDILSIKQNKHTDKHNTNYIPTEIVCHQGHGKRLTRQMNILDLRSNFDKTSVCINVVLWPGKCCHVSYYAG